MRCSLLLEISQDIDVVFYGSRNRHVLILNVFVTHINIAVCAAGRAFLDIINLNSMISCSLSWYPRLSNHDDFTNLWKCWNGKAFLDNLIN